MFKVYLDSSDEIESLNEENNYFNNLKRLGYSALMSECEYEYEFTINELSELTNLINLGFFVESEIRINLIKNEINVIS